MDKQLQNYIKQMHEQGFSDDKVSEELLKSGWTQEVVDAEIKAFREAAGGSTPQPESKPAPTKLNPEPQKENQAVTKKLLGKKSHKKLVLIVAIALPLLSAGGVLGALYTETWNPSWNPFGTEDMVEQQNTQVAEEKITIEEQKTLKTDDYDEAYAFVMDNIVSENSEQLSDGHFRFTHPIFGYSFIVPAGWDFEPEYNLKGIYLTFEDDDLFSRAEINIDLEYGDNLLSEQEILDFFKAESIDEVYQEVGVEGDTMEEILFNETVGIDSIIFDPSQWEKEEFQGLTVYEVTFENESLAPLLAEEDPGMYAYIKKKFIIFDELNYVVMELPNFTFEGAAELYSEELSEEKINEIVDEIKMVFGSFQPGPILTAENLKILSMHDMYWEYMNDVSNSMVQTYNGFYTPTYFPQKVLADSGHIRSVNPSSGLDTVYNCEGGGSIRITQTVSENSISPEDVTSILDNGFIVYGGNGKTPRVASPLGTRIVATNYFDEEGSCELSEEEFLKIIESMQ